MGCSDARSLPFCDRVPRPRSSDAALARLPLKDGRSGAVRLNRLSHLRLWRLVVLFGGLSAALVTRADALWAVQLLREGGCGGILPAAQPLHHNPLLDRAAEQWAAGLSPAAAAARSGYEPESTAALHITGPDDSAISLLKRSNCRTVTDRRLRDIGAYRRGLDTWLVLASVYAPPAASQAPVLATRTLQLVNEVRARGTRCGEQAFGPAPPVRLSATLADVAYGHAADMAEHNYFEHEDRQGTHRRSGSRPSDTGKNWWVRTSPTVRNQPRKWYEAGSTVPVTAKTSWTPDSPRWASPMRRARRPGAACTGFSCWPRPELKRTPCP